MKIIAIGQSFSERINTERRHTADQFGNPGLYVLATPALIWLLEAACHRLLVPLLDPGEGTVGTTVHVDHLAAAPEGAAIDVAVAVRHLEGRRVTFDVQAVHGNRVLMHGSHGRAIIRLDDFRGRLAAMQNNA